MTIQDKLDALQDLLVEKLCGLQDAPRGWLPQIVFVEEIAPNTLGERTTLYRQYKLEAILPGHQTCILINPLTGSTREARLHDISIDWLITLWGCYWDCKGVPEPQLDVSPRPVIIQPIYGHHVEITFTSPQTLPGWITDDFELSNVHSSIVNQLSGCNISGSFSENENDDMGQYQGTWKVI